MAVYASYFPEGECNPGHGSPHALPPGSSSAPSSPPARPRVAPAPQENPASKEHPSAPARPRVVPRPPAHSANKELLVRLRDRVPLPWPEDDRVAHGAQGAHGSQGSQLPGLSIHSLW